MEKPSISFFAMLFALLFSIIGFITIVFDLSGFSLVFELAILLSFMFFLAFGMFLVYHRKKNSWALIAVVLVLLLVDTLLILLVTKKFGIAYFVTVFFAIVGLTIALFNFLTRKPSEIESHYEKGKYYHPHTDEVELKEEGAAFIKEPARNVAKEFIPGKYVASKNASKFHLPRCVWAGNISKENQVWYNSKEEAKSKGLEAHDCAK